MRRSSFLRYPDVCAGRHRRPAPPRGVVGGHGRQATRGAWGALVLATGALSGAGCGTSGGDDGGGGRAASGGSTTTSSGAGTSAASSSSGGTGLRPVFPPAPGWTYWPHTPDDCVMHVPEDLSAQAPLTWEPCPEAIAPQGGCTWMPATWLENDPNREGFKALLTVTKSGGHHYYSVSRRSSAEKNTPFEVILAKDQGEIVGMWRYASKGRCAGGPWLYGGEVVFPLVRYDHPSEPWLFISTPEAVFTNPGSPIPYDPPPYILPTGFAYLTPTMVYLQDEGDNAILLDRRTMTYTGIEDPPEANLTPTVTAAGDHIFVNAFAPPTHDVWIASADGGYRMFLGDDTYAYREIDSDGTHLAWARVQGDVEELWVAPVATDPAQLQARKLADLDLLGVPTDFLTVSDGWVALRHPNQPGLPESLHLYSIETGEERLMPVPEGMRWLSGFKNLTIIDGEVWAQGIGLNGSAANASHIVRYDIDAMPILKPAP